MSGEGFVLPGHAQRWRLRRPGKFYGPVMLGVASTATLASMAGQSFWLGQFKLPMQESLGLSGPKMAALYGVATLIAGLTLGPLGAVIDRLGLRRSTLLGFAVLALACGWCAVAWHWLALAIALVALRMIGQGVMELVGGNTLAAWYERRLGQAAQSVMIVFGLGLLVVTPLVPFAIEALGWRGVYGVFAVILGLVTLLVAWVYVADPGMLGQQRDGRAVDGDAGAHDDHAAPDGVSLRRAAKTRLFWTLAGCLAYYGFMLTAAVFCVNAVVDEAGGSASRGAWMIATLGGSSALSYPLLGRLADRWATATMQSLSTACLAVAMLLLAVRPTGVWLLVIGAVLGITMSAQAATGITAWPRYFGRRHLGAIRGSVQTGIVMASAWGPLVLEAGQALVGGFRVMLLIMAGSAVPFIVAAWLLPRRPGVVEA